jgi:hypothetical protein
MVVRSHCHRVTVYLHSTYPLSHEYVLPHELPIAQYQSSCAYRPSKEYPRAGRYFNGNKIEYRELICINMSLVRLLERHTVSEAAGKFMTMFPSISADDAEHSMIALYLIIARYPGLSLGALLMTLQNLDEPHWKQTIMYVINGLLEE